MLLYIQKIKEEEKTFHSSLQFVLHLVIDGSLPLIVLLLHVVVLLLHFLSALSCKFVSSIYTQESLQFLLITQIVVTLGRKLLLIFADECQLLFETSLLSNVNLFHQTRNRQWRLGLQRFQ